MKPEEAIALYLEHCRQRHYAEGSLDYNFFVLQHLAQYCRLNNITDLRNATTENLLDYHRWVKQLKRPDGEPLSPIYANGHTRQAKALFKFLAGRHYIMSDIGADFPPLHDAHPLPRGILTGDQAMKLLQQPLVTTPLGFRDRTILETLYSTALRARELCHLNVYDYDQKERTLRVFAGKGQKDRVVPIGKVAASYLNEYIQAVRPILLAAVRKTEYDDPPPVISAIFLSAAGLRLRPFDIRRITRYYRKKAGLPDNITPHSLRHTCATEMLKGGASIRHVQELLGHSDIQTTQVYAHVVPSEMKKAHARTSPSEQRKTIDMVTFDAAGKVNWRDKRNTKYWSKVRAKKRLKC